MSRDEPINSGLVRLLTAYLFYQNGGLNGT